MATVIRPPDDEEDMVLEEWGSPYFCQFGAAPATPPLTFTMLPSSDTFRGGREIVIYGEPVLVDSSGDFDFRGQTLSSDWVSMTSMSGSITPTFDGLLLASGRSAGSLASVWTRENEYAAFDVELTVRPVYPPVAPASIVDLCVLQFYIESTHYVQVRLRRDPNVSSSAILADCTITTPDFTHSGASTVLPKGSTYALRIVRYDSDVFVFVDGTKLLELNRFSPGTYTGAFRVTTQNNSSATNTACFVVSMTLHSNAVIDGRLLENRREVSRYRIVGEVPASSLSRVGRRSISIFGPWGSSTDEDGFEYTLPFGLDIGQRSRSKLSTYDRPELRNRA